MKKTTFPAFLSTAIICYIVWLIITEEIVGIFEGEARPQVLIAGGVVSILIALFASRFFIHGKAFHLFNPKRLGLLLFYCIIIFPWELIKANVSMALKAIGPMRNIKPGFVKVPVDLKSEYAQSMLANSITLTPGTITMDIAEDEKDNQTYYYIHWIDVETEDPKKAGDSIKGTMEKWVRRIWE